MALTIVLADDHQVVRDGLRLLLETRGGHRVVGEAADGLEAVRLVEKLGPDVLVADLSMPGLPGIEVARQVAARRPATRVLMLSMYSSENFVLEALRAGCCGYVLKDAGGAELLRALDEVAAGRRYLSPPLSERAIAAWVERTGGGLVDPFDTLSDREREVLHLVAQGQSSSEVGQRLFLSPRTVEAHRASVMRKLGLKSRTELIRWAVTRGLLPGQGGAGGTGPAGQVGPAGRNE